MFAGTAARMLRSRRLMRAPIWLYRARLGGLLGGRLLMLEHIGRVLEQTLGEPVTATNTPLPLVELRLDS